MNKKTLIIILVLSTMITIVGPIIAFGAGLGSSISDGFPLKWTSFNFLGSNTNYTAIIIDIAFWFVIIWGVWKILFKRSKK